MKNQRFALLALTTLLILSACNFPSSAEPKSDPAEEIQTAAVETVNAQYTVNAELSPTVTETEQPSDTPEASNTAEDVATEVVVETATSASICDSIIYVADITIPDGTEMNAGDNFTKTWRLQNAGTCTWTVDYDLVFDSGDAMDGPASQALAGDVAPGEDIDISVVLNAPAAAGEYTGNWKLRNGSGVIFGLIDSSLVHHPFYIVIEVVSGAVGASSITLSPTDRGSVRSDASTNPNPNTGDTDGDVGSQAFVAFDISSIPAAAVIESVQIDFSDFDTLGDPFGSLGCLRAYQGSFFPLDAGDYFAGAALGAVLRWCDSGELLINFLDDDVKDALQAVLGANTFELRLQFNESETDSDATADMSRFGDVKLTISYTP